MNVAVKFWVKKILIFLSFFENSDFQSIVECELRKIIIKSSLDNGEKKWPHIHRPSSIPISDLSRDTAKWFSVDKLDGPGRAKPGWLKVRPSTPLKALSLEFTDKDIYDAVTPVSASSETGWSGACLHYQVCSTDNNNCCTGSHLSLCLSAGNSLCQPGARLVMRQAMTSTTCQLLLLLSSNHGQIQTIRIILPFPSPASLPACCSSK